ncbi:glycosyltransferase [Oceanobacillus kimchii]|uniref:glycosyltransferase n=1 Tax=Oceanobacillus kimchii TaxID=746691 RepID=UPI003C70FCF4
MKPKIYLLMSSVDVDRGGITQASLKQATTFTELGYDTSILTFDFNPKYPLIRKDLVNLKKINDDVKILNLYEHLDGETNNNINQPAKTYTISDFAKENPYTKRKGHNAYRIYENGIYKRYISFNPNNSLNFIDYFNENRYRIRREIYDLQGILKGTKYMDYVTNNPRQSVYYDNNGNVFLTIWQNPESKKITRTIHLKNNTVVKEYTDDSNLGLKVDWINKLITTPTIIISDTRSSDIILANIKSKNTFKVWRLHSNHKEYKDDSTIVKKVETGYKNMDKYDLSLFLTDEQMKDMIDEKGHVTNYKVIPHYHSPKKDKLSILKPTKKDEKLAVIITRFSTLKRVNHAIQAFAEVLKEVPDAKLEVWGSGDQIDNYKKLIKELKLQNNVFINGYTTNPDKIFQNALFSIFTSKSEGFGLSCLESLSNGCPVISYNVKYGPADMINSGENGYLIENGNIERLSEKMIELYKNPKLAIKMGNNASKLASSNYSYKSYKQKWTEVINLATEKLN